MTQYHETLMEDYKQSCNNLLAAFCEKYEFNNDGWTDKYCSAAFCGDFVFSMQTIIEALEGKATTGQLMAWYDYDYTCRSLGLHTVNLRSWLLGCPRYTEEDFNRITELRNRVNDARRELEKSIEELK